MNAADYFGSHEVVVTGIRAFRERVRQIEAFGRATDLKFYWRGQADARWGVHATLYRQVAAGLGVSIPDVTEDDIVARETQIVAAAREWIRPSVGARLTTIDLLARLQHFGAPTRLVDFTSAPEVAAYFAVASAPSLDGRLIVAAARSSPSEAFLDSFAVPWRRAAAERAVDWTTSLFSLDDHSDFPRIVRQSGVFLVGGTPTTRPQRRTGNGELLMARDVRMSTSIPLALHSWRQAEAAMDGTAVPGRPASVASALTLRIPAASKRNLRAALERGGMSWARLFPDAEGFRDFWNR